MSQNQIVNHLRAIESQPCLSLVTDSDREKQGLACFLLLLPPLLKHNRSTAKFIRASISSAIRKHRAWQLVLGLTPDKLLVLL